MKFSEHLKEMEVIQELKSNKDLLVRVEKLKKDLDELSKKAKLGNLGKDEMRLMKLLKLQ